jgi:hypothetical protein
MSPVPEPNESIFEQLKNGGGTAFFVAASGMAARIMLSAKKVSWWKAFRHVLAAGITGFFVGKVLQSMDMADGLCMACVAISGASATEIVEFAVRIARERMDKVSKE